MINNRKRVAERILDLTLEILSVLIGEDYIVVEKSGDRVMCKRTHCDPDGPPRSPGPMPPPHSLSHEQKILELTHKMLSLLTGEVPVRCDDVTVYFSMEEWEYLEGHQELYRDVMMETRQPRTSPVGESACGDLFINSGDCGNGEKCDRLQTDPQSVNTESVTACRPLGDITGQSDRGAHTSKEPARPVPAPTSPAPVTCEATDPSDSLMEHAPIDYTLFHIKEEPVSCDEGDVTDEEADYIAIRIMDDPEETERQLDMWRKPFSCAECAKFLTESPVQNRPQEPFLCSECGRTWGKKPFSCPECGKLFRQSSNLVIHQRIHSGEKPYSCSDCGKSFTCSTRLLNHQGTHRAEKPYSCTQCGKCFTMRNCFNIHRRIHMRQKAQPTVAGEKPYSCTECGKCFRWNSDLVIHQRVHTGVKPYSCSECGKCFSHYSSLVKHQRIHTGEKPYSCFDCGQKFTSSSSLAKHRKAHAGEKPYSCMECGKSFTDNSSLVSHRRAHTGEKPYSCLKCGKSFSYTSSLTKHQRIHTGEKPFSCTYCGRCFAHKSSLNKHTKIHTREQPQVSDIITCHESDLHDN